MRDGALGGFKISTDNNLVSINNLRICQHEIRFFLSFYINNIL